MFYIRCLTVHSHTGRVKKQDILNVYINIAWVLKIRKEITISLVTCKQGNSDVYQAFNIKLFIYTSIWQANEACHLVSIVGTTALTPIQPCQVTPIIHLRVSDPQNSPPVLGFFFDLGLVLDLLFDLGVVWNGLFSGGLIQQMAVEPTHVLLLLHIHHFWNKQHGKLTHWALRDFNKVLVKWFLKFILAIDGWGISHEISFRWISLDLTDDKSTLVQVMAWCHQATSHYLSQCWPRSMSPYGVTRPQWGNIIFCGM